MKEIARFDLGDHSLKMMPEHCKSDLKLPLIFCSTPADAARKPEDVLDYVPGEAWLNLISKAPSSHDRSAAQELVRQTYTYTKHCYQV